jgi:hypothetical protein
LICLKSFRLSEWVLKGWAEGPGAQIVPFVAGSIQTPSLTAQSIANRLNREIRRIRPLTATLAPGERGNSITCIQIPCTKKQGISKVLQGRFFDKQGNYRSTAHVDEGAGGSGHLLTLLGTGPIQVATLAFMFWAKERGELRSTSKSKGERLTSSQNSRNLTTRASRGLPAMMAPLILPIEMPTTQSGWRSASASAS